MRTEVVTRRTAAALGILIGCGGAGCAVGPDYRAPESRLEPFRNAAAAMERKAELPAPPLDQWWMGFNDPALIRIVERALEQNLDIAAARARVESARAAAREAGAELYPSADLAAQAAFLHQSLHSPLGTLGQAFPSYNRNQRLYDLGASAGWEADFFGGLHRGAEAAKAEAETAQARQFAVRVLVAAETADAYLQIRGDQARLKLAEAQIATDSQLLDLVRLRLDAGAAADREVAQAEALLAGARATVPPLRIALEAQMNRLDVLMGAQPGTYAAELMTPAEIPAAPAVSTGDAPRDLLRRRPDVIAAERSLAASNARVGVAIAEYYPKISFSALLGFESLNANRLFTAGGFQPEATTGLRWRLFDFGRVDAEVAQARGAEAEALAQYRQSILRAAEDVEDALRALVELENQSAELAKEVRALAKVRDTSREDYEAGAIALTDVLDADRELLAAQDNLAHGRADTARAAVAVFRALGGGW
jgi:NodT family efflux transporter outer membrane factor (OMF) lipoprotein